jgi:predicted transposase/invertase (TIGR01784 family)
LEGRQEGRREEKFDVARNLLRMDLSIDKIMIATGLTQQEIEELRNSN